MSENGFPFATAAEAPAAEQSEGRGRRPVVLAGAVAGALVLAAGGWFVVGGGGGTADSGAPVALPLHKPAAVTSARTATAPEVVPAAATEKVGRNPFKALYVAPAAAAAGSPSAGTASGATSGTTTATVVTSGSSTSTTPTSTSAPSATGATGATTGTAPAPQPTTPPKYLTVLGVDSVKNQVTFRMVDRTVADPAKAQQDVVVKPGEVFGTYFKLLGYGTVNDASNQPRNCTDLQYGDNRLKLCQGESYQVG